MNDPLNFRSYEHEDGGLVGAVRLTEENFKTVKDLLGASIWHSGTTYEFSVGLIVGEYEDAKHVPFGWWIVMAGGTTEFLADVAFTNEYTEV